MNVEIENGINMNDPAVLDERIASVVNTLVQVADPRLIINALLGTAAELATLVLAAEPPRASPAMIAHVFSNALVVALQPRTAEAPLIQVVPAGVIDLSKHR